jgi:hypothetical protein
VLSPKSHIHETGELREVSVNCTTRGAVPEVTLAVKLVAEAVCGRIAPLIVIESVSAAVVAGIIIESRIPKTMMLIAFWYPPKDIMQPTP